MKVIGRTGSRGQARFGCVKWLGCLKDTAHRLCSLPSPGHTSAREVLGRPEPPDHAQREGPRPRGCVCPALAAVLVCTLLTRERSFLPGDILTLLESEREARRLR
jgi:hypothetical protein